MRTKLTFDPPYDDHRWLKMWNHQIKYKRHFEQPNMAWLSPLNMLYHYAWRSGRKRLPVCQSVSAAGEMNLFCAGLSLCLYSKGWLNTSLQMLFRLKLMSWCKLLSALILQLWPTYFSNDSCCNFAAIALNACSKSPLLLVATSQSSYKKKKKDKNCENVNCTQQNKQVKQTKHKQQKPTLILLAYF